MIKTTFHSFIGSVPVRYTLIPSIFLSFVAVISVDPHAWMVSDTDHFYFEMFAVVLSAIVAIYCLTRARTLSEKFSFFVGIGFLTNAVIDFFHATLSYSAAGNSVFLAYFIPQTWFAGRTFLGTMLVIAVAKYVKTNTSSQTAQLSAALFAENDKGATAVRDIDSQLKRPLLFSIIILAILAVSVVGISFFTVFPGIVIDFPLHRPYEIPALVLFSVALLLF